MDTKTGNNIGTLKVSAGVIVSIAETAAAETEGVAVGSDGRIAVSAGGPLTSKFISPVRVKLSADSAAIAVDIITESGYKAFEVAKAVQEHVKSSVQNMTGIAVSKVNVRITAIRSK